MSITREVGLGFVEHVGRQRKKSLILLKFRELKGLRRRVYICKGEQEKMIIGSVRYLMDLTPCAIVSVT